MRFFRGTAAALASAVGISCATHGAIAQESGMFSAIANYLRHFATMEHAGETIFSGTLEGSVTILESTGGPFVKGGHSVSKCVVYGKRSVAGVDLETPCTTTNASGDHLYLLARRSAGDVKAGGGGQGHFELMGGTGVYAGLAGRCAYSTEYLANNRVVTRTDCTWRKR